MRPTFWIALGAIAAAAALAPALGVRWNTSESVATGLYLERERRIERGDLVAVCLPEPLGRWAAGRGYLGKGRCPGEAARLGKWIAATHGDCVEVRHEGILINGRWLEGTRRVDRDARGRPVPLVPEGDVVLGPGQVWLHSGRRARSFDSRVFGPLDQAQVRGVLEPLWSLGED